MTKIPNISEEKLLHQYGYKLNKKIAEGGYAKIYLAEFQAKNEKKVYQLACKVMNLSKASGKHTDKFLPREMKILFKISHPHIIHIHNIFQCNRVFFIFMRYAEKGDLSDFLRSNGALDEPQARYWVRQIALAIQYLHTLEIAHRDIKCENILITQNHNVKLADFGFSRYSVDKDRKQIFSETFCGTLEYAPPEIIKRTPYNPKMADMWSLGIVIYTMMNKAFPFTQENPRILVRLQLNKKWKFRTQYSDKMSAEGKTLIGKLLEPDPTIRYTIEQVIHSDWIAMDPKLKVLNAAEYKAISTALEEIENLANAKLEAATKSISLNIRSITKDNVKSYKTFLGQTNEFAFLKSEVYNAADKKIK